MKGHLLVSTAVVMCLALAACSKKTATSTETASNPAGGTTTTTTTTAPTTGPYGTATNETTPGTSSTTTETAPGTTGTYGGAPPSDQSMASTTTPPATSAADETTSQGFVQKAAVGDLFEIQASKELLTKSGIDPKVKEFAQKMVTAHTATSKQLKTIAGGESVTVPTSLDSEHQAMLDQLKSSSGAAAVNLYLDQQTSAHQDALSLMQNCSANCTDAQLKQFAENTAPDVQKHLDDAKALKAVAPPTNM